MGLCSISDWLKILRILNQVYKKEFNLERNFLSIFGKLLKPERFSYLDVRLPADTLNELCTVILQVVRYSEDVMVVAEGLNTITDIFRTEVFDAYFLSHDFFKVLVMGKSNFLGRAKQHLRVVNEDEREFLQMVIQNLGPFIDYKEKKLQVIPKN